VFSLPDAGVVVSLGIRAAAARLVHSHNVNTCADADVARLAGEAARCGLALVGQRELALLRLALCDAPKSP
jgi:fructose-specific component phosphotransferase system IIB-like protein